MRFSALSPLPTLSTGGTTPYSAIHAGDFKLIEFHDDMRVELYNLREDIDRNTISRRKCRRKSKNWESVACLAQ
jgi:hypothetical protein